MVIGASDTMGAFNSKRQHFLSLLQEALCPNDVIVFGVHTVSYGTGDFKGLVDRVVAMARKQSARVVIFPDDIELKDDPRFCASQSPPSTCLVTRKEVDHTMAPYLKQLEQYKNASDVLIIRDVDDSCYNDHCDAFVPNTRTIGYRDPGHRSFIFHRFLEPFVCMRLLNAGFLQ